MPNKMLIIEDARADRERYRTLLESMPEHVAFAWAWDARGCSVMNWFRERCGSVDQFAAAGPGAALKSLLDGCGAMDPFEGFSLVLLDLAWSRPAEDAVRKLQFLRTADGTRLAEARISTRPGPPITPPSETDAGYVGQYRRLSDRLEGIALLDWLDDRQPGTRRPEVWVTSTFVTTQARGLRQFLRVAYDRRPDRDLFHKWADEEPLAEAMKSFLRQ